MSSTPPSVPPTPAPQVPVTPVANATLIGKIDAVIAKLDAYAKAEEAKAATSVTNFFKKHWPWMAGAAIAATRLLHL